MAEYYDPTDILRQEEEYTPTDLADMEEYTPTDTGDIEERNSGMKQNGPVGLQVCEFTVREQGRAKKQTYTVNFSEGLGGRDSYNQARIHPCTCEADQKEYTVKLYEKFSGTEWKFNAVELRAILNIMMEEKGRSPYVVKILGHGDCRIAGCDYYYVLMPKYEKRDFKLDYLKFCKEADYQERLINFIGDLNRGLRHLHELGILYGDFKPDNIMYSPDTGNPVLIDLGGSVRARRGEEKQVAKGVTHKYMSPAFADTHIVCEKGDYFSFGVTLVELIDGGIYPKEDKKLEKQTGVRLMKIGLYYYVPETIPDWLKNLFSGLLYVDREGEDFAWTTDKVNEWYKKMRGGKEQEAAQDNKTPEQKTEQRVEQRFREVISLPLGPDGGERPVDSLTSLADLAARNWKKGVAVFLDPEEYFSEEDVKKNNLRIIKGFTNEMKGIAPESGKLYDGVFFKFLYTYMSDKRPFIWNRMSKVKDLETLAGRLLSTLNTLEKSSYRLGEWWKDGDNENPRMSTRFAELFYNKILGIYLEKIDYDNEEVRKLCSDIERFFDKNPRVQVLPLIQVSNMYLMARLILDYTEYELNKNMIFRDYEEFLQTFSDMAYDPRRKEEALKIWEKITIEKDYSPAFYAWLRLHLKEKAGNITHGIKGRALNRGKK